MGDTYLKQVEKDAKVVAVRAALEETFQGVANGTVDQAACRGMMAAVCKHYNVPTSVVEPDLQYAFREFMGEPTPVFDAVKGDYREDVIILPGAEQDFPFPYAITQSHPVYKDPQGTYYPGMKAYIRNDMNNDQVPRMGYRRSAVQSQEHFRDKAANLSPSRGSLAEELARRAEVMNHPGRYSERNPHGIAADWGQPPGDDWGTPEDTRYNKDESPELFRSGIRIK